MTQIETVNFDSEGLNHIFSSLSNPLTGLGTARDKTKKFQINQISRLSQKRLENLYRGEGVLTRLINCYPLECRRDWMSIKQIRLENQPEQPVGELLPYLEKLKNKTGKIGVKEAFTQASILGRHHGDGFILIGIADGQEPNQPVNEKSIQSIEWLKILNRYEIYPDSKDYHNPEYYSVWANDVERIWHYSRVLRFSGTKLYDKALSYNGGYNDSVLQKVFDTWSAWQQGLMAGSAMLADYDQGVYGFKGLGQALKEDLRAGTNTRQQQIQKRLLSAEMGRSVMKALLLDMDEESFNYVTRSYGGASQIMELLKDALISQVDLPEYKLFNKTNSAGALSTQQTAGLAQRYDWNSHKNNWITDNWIEPYEKLLRYAMLAKDSPLPTEVEIQVSANAKVELTPLEKIEAQVQAVQRDAQNIELGIYSPLTAQNAYKQGEWDGQIHLAQEDLL
jgi:phage-related protein (TIGR01555 family)